METAAVNQMKELVKKLNEAAKAYYQEDREIMSNREYDALYDQLEQMEAETGIVLADSPTVNVGYEAVDALPKETHESPMLSLDKTKERETLRAFIGTHPTLLSWKMDGLTIVLTYENGELAQSSHQRKRNRRGSHHQQCEDIQEYPTKDRLSGQACAEGRGDHHLFRF